MLPDNLFFTVEHSPQVWVAAWNSAPLEHMQVFDPVS